MIGIVRHHRWLKRLMAAYGCELPKRSTVLLVLVFDRLTRGARLRTTRFPLSRSHRQELGDLFARSCALLVLVAYDDPFDRWPSHHDLCERYDYLVRALGGFLAGFHSDLPIPRDEYFPLLDRLEAVFDEMKGALAYPEALEQDRTRLWRSPFVAALRELSSISAADFLYSAATSPSDCQRNVPIVAAIQLGRALRRLHAVLHDVGLPASLLRDQERAIAARLIRAGHAQAHTVEQCDIDRIGWRRYCQLSLWKTNSMIEIGAFLRGLLDVDALHFRLGCNRFCEQIYLDDLYDILEDTKAGVAGAAHVFVREQGALATELLRGVPDLARASRRIDHRADALLASSGLLDRWSESAFLQASPFVGPPAVNDPDDRAWRSRLREALTNLRSEKELRLEELLYRRRRAWEELRTAWRARDHRRVVHVLHLSGVPLRLVRGFLRHLREVRPDYLPGGRPGLSGAGHFLFLQVATRLLLVRFLLARRVASVAASAPERGLPHFGASAAGSSEVPPARGR